MKWLRDDSGTQRGQPIHREREALVDGEEWNSFPDVPWKLACYKNVWDSANFREDSCRDLVQITTEDRGESCYFFRFIPGMVFQTGEDLQRREEQRKANANNQIWTKRSVQIAFAALIVAVLGLVAYIIWK